MPVLDPLGLPRCAVCANAFMYDADPEATTWLRERGVLAPGAFICRSCVARIQREYGRLPFQER